MVLYLTYLAIFIIRYFVQHYIALLKKFKSAESVIFRPQKVPKV